MNPDFAIGASTGHSYKHGTRLAATETKEAEAFSTQKVRSMAAPPRAAPSATFPLTRSHLWLAPSQGHRTNFLRKKKSGILRRMSRPIAKSRLKGVCVLGTDTGVGKTCVASLLARGLALQGVEVDVFKPFASGSYSDARSLWEAAGRRGRFQDVVGFYYEKPLAPAMRFLKGEAEEGDRVWSLTRMEYRRKLKACQVLVVEGVGGVLSPVVGKKTLLDWLRPRLPVWLVARPGLGTLNQILLCLEVLKRRRVKADRVILTPFQGKTLVEKTNLQWLKAHVTVPVFLLPGVDEPRERDKWADVLSRLAEEDLEWSKKQN